MGGRSSAAATMSGRPERHLPCEKVPSLRLRWAHIFAHPPGPRHHLQVATVRIKCSGAMPTAIATLFRNENASSVERPTFGLSMLATPPQTGGRTS